MFKLLRREALPLTTMAGMLAWFCHEIIFSAQLPFFRDLSTYFYPIKFSIAEAFKSFTLPLWDYRIAAGFPMMAGFQSAVFYPPSLAYAVLPFFAALRFTFVFHYGLALTGAYLLFRSWKASVVASLIGAVFFSFSGTLVSLSNLLNHFQSAAWLPWFLYSWERAVRDKTWAGVFAFVLVALCQALAGSPEIFFLSIAILCVDTLRMAQKEKLPSFRMIAGRATGAACLLAGLGMIQWLPTAELVMQSRRNHAIHMTEALSWSLQPSQLIGLVFPTLEPDPSLTTGVRLLFASGVPFLMSLYIGVLGTVGLANWMLTAPARERVFVFVAMTVGLLFACGSLTPLYPLIYEWVPPVRIMRFPEKYWFVCFALTTFVIVRGIHHITEHPKSNAPCVIATSICIAFSLVYVGFRAQPQLVAQFATPIRVETGFLVDSETIAAILFLLERQVAVSLGVVLVLWLHRFNFLSTGVFGTILVIVLFFDLSSVTRPLHFLRDQNLLVKVPRILDEPPRARVRLFYYPPDQNMHPSIMKVGGNPSYEKAMEIPFNNLLPNAGVLYGFEYFQDIDALGRQSYTEFLIFTNALREERRGKLLRTLNVGFVIAFHALNLPELKPPKQFPEYYSALYEVTLPVPRAYIAQRAFYHADATATLNRVAGDDFDPLRDVVLDAAVSLNGGAANPEKPVIRVYDHRRVVIDAKLSEPGVLVLTDSYYPGWKVFVNGRERTVHRANLLFRGVVLPAGAHEVEFTYDPLSFKIGLIISLITCVVLIVVILIRAARRHHAFATSNI